jgi:hypothetical protein
MYLRLTDKLLIRSATTKKKSMDRQKKSRNRVHGVGFGITAQADSTTVNAGITEIMTREEWRELYRGELGEILGISDNFS